MQSTAFKGTTIAFKASAKPARALQRRVQVCCSADPSDHLSRRGLIGALTASVAAAPMLLSASPAEAKMVDKVISAKYLSAFQRADLINAFQKKAEGELSKVLTSADAPAALRLLLHDAATYDAAARTGGVNGSIVLSEELSRPENKDLKGLVDKLAGVRKALEASKPAGQKNISWADTIVLAAKVTQDMAWREEKLKKNPKNGEYLVENFSTPITIRLGRRDASEPDAAGRFPAPGSSPSEVRAFMSLLGEKDPSALEGPFGRKAAFWDRPTFVLWTAAQPDPAAAEAAFAADPGFAQWKDKYDKSRKTNFRTDYEVDFVAFFNKLADLGAKFDKEAYLYDLVMKVPDRL